MRYHFLLRSKDTRKGNIAFHLDTPAGNSTAGISYKNLLLRTRGASSQVRQLSLDFPAEWHTADAGGETHFEDGSRFEYLIQGFEFSLVDGALPTAVQRRDQIRATYISLANDIADPNSDLFNEVFGVQEWMFYAEDYDGSWSTFNYPNNGTIPTP